jgi:hypothetical protein
MTKLSGCSPSTNDNASPELTRRHRSLGHREDSSDAAGDVPCATNAPRRNLRAREGKDRRQRLR